MTFNAQYTLDKNMISSAYKTYQKQMRGKRDVIFRIIFALIAVYYICFAISKKANTMTYVIIFVCLAVIAVTWYNPKKLHRSVMECFDEISGDKYQCSITDEEIIIETLSLSDNAEDVSEIDAENAAAEGRSGIEPTVIPINKINVFDKEDCFIIGNTSIFYALPKQAFESADKLSEFFKEKLGSSYRIVK